MAHMRTKSVKWFVDVFFMHAISVSASQRRLSHQLTGMVGACTLLV